MPDFYSAGEMKVTWDGIDLSDGWGTDTFLTITKDAPHLIRTASVSGSGSVYSKPADKGATITMTFLQTAEACKEIASRLALQSAADGNIPISVFKVEDPVGGTILFYSADAVLMESGEQTWGNEVSERTYTWHTDTYIDTKDISTVTGARSNFA